MSSIYLQCIVRRRNIRTIRDLEKSDALWLTSVRRKIIDAVTKTYLGIASNQLKLYVHCEWGFSFSADKDLPSYFHFHIHVTHVDFDGGYGQAAGRAILLENLISQLDCLSTGKQLSDCTVAYTIGENNELWRDVLQYSA